MSVWLSRWLVSLLLRRIRVGSLIVVEGDERRAYGSGPPGATVRIRSSRTWRMLLRGSRGMAEAFAQGLWDSPDLVALIRLAARNAGGLDRLRSRLAPLRWPLQRARALSAPQHEAPAPTRHRRPLRPRQRAVRADARSDDELLVCALRARGDDARAGAGRKARAHLRAARPRSGGSRARDRNWLGWLRASCRRDPRLPRDHDHDLARAARLRRRAGPPRRD